MSCGKIAGQTAHASVRALLSASDQNAMKWFEEGETKIVLKVSSEKDLMKVAHDCQSMNINCSFVHDLGKTQIEAGTLTAIGIGPDEDMIINTVIKDLKLL